MRSLSRASLVPFAVSAVAEKCYDTYDYPIKRERNGPIGYGYGLGMSPTLQTQIIMAQQPDFISVWREQESLASILLPLLANLFVLFSLALCTVTSIVRKRTKAAKASKDSKGTCGRHRDTEKDAR